jgi:hypothetical protein
MKRGWTIRLDFGGCRCQALQILGDAEDLDPACHLRTGHDIFFATPTFEVATIRSTYRRTEHSRIECLNLR